MSSPSSRPSLIRRSAHIGSDMRRTSSVLTISRPASPASERDTANSYLSGSTRDRNLPESLGVDPQVSSSRLIGVSPANNPFLTVSRPDSAVFERDTANSFLSGNTRGLKLSLDIDPQVSSSRLVGLSPIVSNPGPFADITDDLLQPVIAQDPQAVAPIEPHVEPSALNPPEPAEPEAIITEALVDKPNSFESESIKDFEPHVEPVALNPPEPAEPEAIITEALVDKPNSFEPEGIKDFEPDNDHQGPAETDSHDVIVMPLPSFNDVIASIPTRHTPPVKNGDTGNLIETNENLPLLPRPARPFKHIPSSYLQKCPRDLVSISPLVYSATSNENADSWHPHHPGDHPRLHNLGWLEYHLPDETVYYVHPTNKVTTEINLRSEGMLTGVERFLADYTTEDQSGYSGSAMEEMLDSGGEIWLRDVGTEKSGLVLESWWVDHRLRTVVMSKDEHEHARNGSGKGKTKKGGTVFCEEDRLDTEYRYWSFMEAHPAHNPLPEKAKMEAIDMLTWTWTERPLSSHRAVPAPFTQEECQELIILIQSFGDDSDDHGIQTRIVSRFFRRVAQWRQTYFRPNKPLPTDVCSKQSHLPITPHQPFKWVIIDFIVSCLFLGIPYIFFGRTRLSTWIVGEESNSFRYATSTLVIIGACTCLVAVTVLNASVNFFSLPSLNAFSRITAMVAILFSAFSVAATVVAIFTHKADLERPNIS